MEPVRIRFDSALPIWMKLAEVLDPPYITKYDNWEAVAEKLDFKPREIRHIRSLKHETGSNTILMFERYVQKSDGGDLNEVKRILESLNRQDALHIITTNYDDIAERNNREYGQEQMVIEPPHPSPPPPLTYEPLYEEQRRQILELQWQKHLLEQERRHFLRPSSQDTDLDPRSVHPGVPDQVRYVPTDKQRMSIPQHVLSRLCSDAHGQQHMRYVSPQRMQPHPQETPINLKKPCAPLQQVPEVINRHGRRTQDDFVPGFGQQFRELQSNPSLEPQLDSLSMTNSSCFQHSRASMYQGSADRPGDFPEVLIRGRHNLVSLNQPPMVIEPSATISSFYSRTDDNHNYRHQPMDMSESSSTNSSENYYLKHDSDALRDSMNSHTSSEGMPTAIIKEEKVDSAELNTVVGALQSQYQAMTTDEPQAQLRQSVIHMGPQCSSLPAASPGNLSDLSCPVTVKDEVEAENQTQSVPQGSTQILIGRGLRPKRYTWPLTSRVVKDKMAEKVKQPIEDIKQHSISVDRDYKQPLFKKKPVKVLLTYTLHGSHMKSHKKEIIVLYNCLKKNDFLPSLDLMEPQEFYRDTVNWIDTKFREANFVIVCISPEYRRDVDNLNDNAGNSHTRYCRYIYRMMQNEFTSNSARNKRFLPVLFPGSTQNNVPMWLQSTMAFRWREHWRDILYMMKEPEQIMLKIKRNKERFAESKPVIKMSQMS